jgi:hypothetical protein
MARNAGLADGDCETCIQNLFGRQTYCGAIKGRGRCSVCSGFLTIDCSASKPVAGCRESRGPLRAVQQEISQFAKSPGRSRLEPAVQMYYTKLFVFWEHPAGSLPPSLSHATLPSIAWPRLGFRPFQAALRGLRHLGGCGDDAQPVTLRSAMNCSRAARGIRRRCLPWPTLMTPG